MSYVLRHWRGDLSITVAVWVNLLAVQLAVGIAIGFVIGYQAAFGTVTPLWAYWLSNAVSLVVTVWGLVGGWRSASRVLAEIREGRRDQGAWWGHSARVLVGANTLFLVFSMGVSVRSLTGGG